MRYDHNCVVCGEIYKLSEPPQQGLFLCPGCYKKVKKEYKKKHPGQSLKLDLKFKKTHEN